MNLYLPLVEPPRQYTAAAETGPMGVVLVNTQHESLASGAEDIDRLISLRSGSTIHAACLTVKSQSCTGVMEAPESGDRDLQERVHVSMKIAETGKVYLCSYRGEVLDCEHCTWNLDSDS